MPRQRKVLLVIGDRRVRERIAAEIECCGALAIRAASAREGLRAAEENPTVDLIMVHSCIDGALLQGLKLVDALREFYIGHIMSVSTISDENKEMVRRGCNSAVLERIAEPKAIEFLRLEKVQRSA